jgi:hypothetical protein
MCSYQGEPVLVLVDVMDRDLPAVSVVAKFAFGPVLSAVQICVAILALIGSVCEFEI